MTHDKLAYIKGGIIPFDARSSVGENEYNKDIYVCIGKGTLRQLGSTT